MKTMEWLGGHDWQNKVWLTKWDDFPNCCALQIVSFFPEDHLDDNNHWDALIDLLDKAQFKETILVSLSQKNQTKMIDLLEATPYWNKIAEVKSTIGKYYISLYLVKVPK